MRDNIGTGPGRRAFQGLGLLLVVGATGCGTSVGSVSGKVTFKGEPVGGGIVTFHLPGKPAKTAPIGPDGSYSIDDVPIGELKIAVDTSTAKPAEPPPEGTVPQNMPPEARKSAVYGGKRPEGGKYVEIPANYSDTNTSGLTYTVKTGSQTHKIELK
jgi:hypothetical protein